MKVTLEELLVTLDGKAVKSKTFWSMIFKLRNCFDEKLISADDYHFLYNHFLSPDLETVAFGLSLLQGDKFKNIHSTVFEKIKRV